jgi:hypothetical protein
MSLDDFLAALDGLLRTLLDIRGRLRGQRTPAALEIFERRAIKRVVSPMTVPLERGTQRSDFILYFFGLAILSIQGIALLLEDFIDALVFITDLLEKLPELRGIVHQLRRHLT